MSDLIVIVLGGSALILLIISTLMDMFGLISGWVRSLFNDD